MIIVISSPTATPADIAHFNALFDAGLSCLHLRLPDACRSDYEAALLAIPPHYRHRVVVCDYFELAEKYGLGGIHLRADRRHEHPRWYRPHLRISTSVHSIAELQSLPFVPTYALLSPVFDSISKSGYTAAIDFEECRRVLPKLSFPVVALGGVTPQRLSTLCQYGFSGVSVVGYVSPSSRPLLSRFCAFPQPEVLTIAGHDPASGAGLVADALTLVQAGVAPLTITAALTVQDAYSFERVLPIEERDLLSPLTFLLQQGHVPLAAKIGLVPSLDVALQVARTLRQAGVRHIVWDPVLLPSAAADSANRLYALPAARVQEMLQVVTLVTPNLPEAKALFGTTDSEQLQSVARTTDTAILLKGGHGGGACSTDLLITTEQHVFSVPRTMTDKHGTGCRLSAHIAARLAQGFPLLAACRMGQWSVDAFRRSSPDRVGRWSISALIPSVQKTEKLRHLSLQYLTDSPQKSDILTRCREVLDGGIRWIQLRMKHATHEERVDVARSLKTLMSNYDNAVLIIDDDVQAVLESDADGVHLGLLDLSPVEARQILGHEKIIGGTCNQPQHLRQRALEGVDYVGVGPYRFTTTKANLSALLGEEGMRALVETNLQLPFPLPMVGIGGVEIDDLPTIARIGLHGVALSGVINRAANVSEMAMRLSEHCSHLFLH